MKKVNPQPSWPETWQYSYPYDLMEIYGDKNSCGYAYAYANRRQHILDLIQQVAKPGAKVLDAAAGQGNFSLTLAELGYEVTWNDLRAELVDYVKLKWEKGTIHYVAGDIFSLGDDLKFDVILIAEVIEHVAHPDEFLSKVSQMLKPGGYIVMSTPNGEYFQNRLPRFSDCPDPSKFEAVQFKPDSDGHIFLLHIDEVESIAKQVGLKILETRIFTNPLSNGHLKLRFLLKFLPRLWVNKCEKLTTSLPVKIKKRVHTAIVVLFQIPVQS
ncbi:class I SAM-dependent methyltransferase [Synechocystis sp. PCC 7509]|uniref:class I SAM-dependent methyltransferase n=1 Tax=Synechocystis sp. PCC 7509 TaxID=927677 RepID=UPI0002AC726B|nr:methyltransferase domain-containing protein [Synechocystis sp. PCC 7509]